MKRLSPYSDSYREILREHSFDRGAEYSEEREKKGKNLSLSDVLSLLDDVSTYQMKQRE